MAVDAWTVRTLASAVGSGVAARLMLAAGTLDVAEAQTRGLVDRVGDRDDALAWAHEVAALAPLALAHAKGVLRGADDEAAARTFEACWASDDVREGRAARAERRDPVFRGR